MKQLDYTMVFVSDMAKSIAFYRDALGLPLRMESPQWTEFDTPGCTLALHLTEDKPVAPKPGASPAGSCAPGFQVPDLAAFHQHMITRKVPCVTPPYEAEHGLKLAQYADPDGLPIWVAEISH